ncbi:tape measure protein [Brucella rhizosphaerae]|uniref:tape measure protein n=1 Tax=Brucella rhizosphaerae TaxID=571254 RepID=UPI000464ACC7|nr:tape measure domain-containing protein [Brucella rhizosphaerae]
MARTDLESLVVQLSADFKSFEKSLARANDVSNRQFNAIERRARQMNKNLDSIFTRSFSGLTAPLAGIGAALGVDQLRKMTDTWTDMTSRVNLAAGSIDKGTEVMGRLGEMARRTYSDLSQTAESYLSNATALRELGYNTDESLNYTEALNNALVVSGAKGDRAARVIDALAKAMATGKLQGDNLNTVIESGGRVAEALAAGLDTTVGGLRKLGSQGKITGNDIVRGLSSQMETLRQEAADMPATIGDGFTLLNNALLQYVGNADSAAGVSAKISEALVMIADNFDKVADGALQVAAVIAGALVGRSLLGMIRTLGTAGVALGQFRQALAAASTMGGLATAFGGLGAAAGPVGMVIGGAVVSSLILYNSTVGESSQGATLFAERLNKVEEAAKSSGNAVEQAGRQNDAYTQNSLSKEVEAGTKEMEAATEAAVNMLASFAQVSSMSLITPEQYDELARLRDGVKEGTVSAEEAKQSLFAMANADYNFQEVADAIGPILDRLAMVSTAARSAAADLAAVTGARAVIEDRSTRSAKDPYIMQREAANEYERDQMRLAALSKKEHALEMERKKVRDAATKDGIALTEQQIDAIARANVAAQESRTAEGKKPKKERQKKTPEDKFNNDVRETNDRTAALVAETEALRQINPLIDDYGFAAEKARTEQELLNAAQKAGIAITPELRSQIAQTAQQWALATAEANKLNEAQGELRQKSSEWRSTELDAFKGLVTDLSSGKDAVEALTDAVQKLIDKLLDMTLNNLFEGLFGKSGSIFGAFLGFKDGGLPKFANGTPSRPGPGLIRGPGTGRSDSILARVSNKEFITNARSTAKYRGLLEAINQDRLPAFADGTPSLRAPSMPILSAPQRAGAAGPMRVDVVTRFENDGNFHSYVENVSQSTSSRTVKAYDKSGPMRFARDSKQASRRGLVR